MVHVTLDADAWHGHAVEALWAEALDDGAWLVRSVPFFAFELAAEDEVEVEKRADGSLWLTRVVRRGGSSVYRVLADGGLDTAGAEARLEALEELDCYVERRDAKLAAIDVPPQADLDDVYAILEDGAEAGIWEFEEGWAAVGDEG